MAETFLRRSLAAGDYGGLRVLDALRWPTPFGSGFRLYPGRHSEFDALRLKEDATVSLSETISVAKNGVVDGEAPAGDGALPLDLRLDHFEVETGTPETELFDDLNVILALRHSETPEQVAEWMKFHIEHHETQGILLFDRTAPGPDKETFAAGLQNIAGDVPELARLVLVTADVPLGRADRPALGDPASARKAKDKAFTPDPWRAPLNEPILYDALKMRFLARAGAVLALDPCDYLQPSPDGISHFEACRKSHTGFMPVQGQVIFPWRIRKGREPTIGDHICRHEPAMSAPNRWLIAPKRIGADSFWLPGNVTGAVGLTDEVASYDRALGLIFQTAEIPTLVNKDALVLDSRLLSRATEEFGAKPVLPPERKVQPTQPTATAPSGRTVIVTCMKNEGPFILEWIAYHRMIGVDDFLVYTNDCDDGTVEILNRLQEMGILQRRENPFHKTGAKPQQSALDAASREKTLTNAGWIISMDVDEFINIHVGAGRLSDLYAAIGGANMISLTWRLFGNSDVVEFQDIPVTAQFTRCAPELIRRPHQAWGFKTLFKNQGMWEGMGVHRPRGHLGGANWVNGSGQPMPPRLLRTGWRSDMDTWGYKLATLNHYSVRSVDSFLVKRERGRVNHVARDQGEAYWFRMNNNDEQDLSIQRQSRQLENEIASLKADPVLGALHEKSVAAHRAKIETLKELPEYNSLHERLRGERMQRLSRLHRHLGLNVFLHGPSVVPDNLLDPNLPPNTFFNTAPPDGKAAD